MNKWDWAEVALAYFVTFGSVLGGIWLCEKIGCPPPLQKPEYVISISVALAVVWAKPKRSRNAEA